MITSLFNCKRKQHFQSTKQNYLIIQIQLFSYGLKKKEILKKIAVNFYSGVIHIYTVTYYSCQLPNKFS